MLNLNLLPEHTAIKPSIAGSKKSILPNSENLIRKSINPTTSDNLIRKSSMMPNIENPKI